MTNKAWPVEQLEPRAMYRLMTGLVVPRPIAFVSTVSGPGRANLAPFSFYNVASTDPPVLTIAVDHRYGREVKDTLRNILDNREFVVNVATEELAESVNIASLDWPSEVDEFVKAGLTARWDCLHVKPPRVLESPAQFECELLQTVDFGQWTLVLGGVIVAWCREQLLDNRMRVDVAALHPLGRLAGDQYCTLGERFSIARAADSPGA